MPFAAPSPARNAHRRLTARLSLVSAAALRRPKGGGVGELQSGDLAARASAEVARHRLWRFADPALDAVFTPSANAVFELAAATLGDHAAMGGLAAALAASLADRSGAVVWICTGATAREHGALSGRGLAAFGMDPARVMCVAAKNDREALWATEEAATSGAAAGVITELGDADFTATRRLALRARATPVLLALPHGREGATAAQARWRVAAHASGPDPDDPRAPGRPRWRAVLERCRSPAFAGAPQSFVLEWCDETTADAAGDAVRLRVAPELADAAMDAGPPPGSGDGRRLRAV